MAKNFGEQRRSGHKRRRTSAKKALAALPDSARTASEASSKRPRFLSTTKVLAITGKLEEAQGIIDTLPDPDLPDKDGLTPLQMVCLNQGVQDLFRECGHADVGPDRLILAQRLLDRGADPNLRAGKEKLSALHLAAIFGSQKLSALLIRYGARCDLQDSDGCLPADLAEENDNRRLAAYLRKEGLKMEYSRSAGRLRRRGKRSGRNETSPPPTRAGG